MRYTCYREGLIRVIGKRICSPGETVHDLRYRAEIEVDTLDRGMVLEVGKIPEIAKRAIKGRLAKLSCEQIAEVIVKGIYGTFIKSQREGELVRVMVEVSPTTGDPRGVSVEWNIARD